MCFIRFPNQTHTLLRYLLFVGRIHANMYQAQIHVDQEKDCVLTDLTDEFGESFDIDIEKLHDNKVTFIIEAEDLADEYYTYLSNSASVVHVEQLNDDYILVTKSSCGAYSAVAENHGVLRRPTKIDRTQRVYTVLFFERATLKEIIAGFRDIGSVKLAQITSFSDTNTTLTDRQHEVLEHAFENGYFDWPRQFDSEMLAADLDITHSTYLEHLRKAEEQLIRQHLSEQLSSSTLPSDSILMSDT